MAKVEVDEADFNAFQARAQLTGLVQGILKNPKARAKLLEAQKEAYPDVVVPEIDAARPVLDKVAELSKQIEDDRKQRVADKEAADAEKQTNAFRASWELGKQAVRSRYKDWNETAISAVEKFAEEKGIPDFEAAAARYREMNPPAQVEAPSGSGGWNFFEQPQDDIKDFMEKQMTAHGDDDMGLSRQVNAVLAEIRGQPPRRAA